MSLAHLLAQLGDGGDVRDVVEDARAKRRLREGADGSEYGGVGVHGHLLQGADARVVVAGSLAEVAPLRRVVVLVGAVVKEAGRIVLVRRRGKKKKKTRGDGMDGEATRAGKQW